MTSANTMDVDGARIGLVVIPGASHMVNMEQPDLFNETVLEFLLGHPRTGRTGESGMTDA